MTKEKEILKLIFFQKFNVNMEFLFLFHYNTNVRQWDSNTTTFGLTIVGNKSHSLFNARLIGIPDIWDNWTTAISTSLKSRHSKEEVIHPQYFYK